MRGDLVKVKGVSDIQTDIPARICKFKLANSELDIKAKLAELSKTNSHIRGWKIVETVN